MEINTASKLQAHDHRQRATSLLSHSLLMGQVGAQAAHNRDREPFAGVNNSSEFKSKRNPSGTTETRSLLLMRPPQSGQRLIFNLD
jgi:hypothetical protein